MSGEKVSLPNPNIFPKPLAASFPERSRRYHRKAVRIVCFGLLCWTLISTLRGYKRPRSDSSYAGSASVDPERIWDQLQSLPPGDLKWEKCYTDHFECARMTVPLDYSKASLGSASIALIRYPAKVPVDREEYKGPILFNPGGPSGSGVMLIQNVGPMFQELLGQEYDIVGWDPRGVGRTTPQVDLFPDSAEGAAFRIRMQDDPLVNTTADAVSRLHARWSTLSGIAAVRTNHTSPYVTTALVARDMLSILHAFGREKLQYWGFSYGTVLGATFAAMFPDHIERMILDGVVDTDDYASGRWEKHLTDTDKVFREFADGCVEAGADVCGLYQSTPEQVLDRLHRLFAKLKKNPIVVPMSKNDVGDYGLISYKLVKSTLLMFAYKPYAIASPLGAPQLSVSLAELEKDNGTPLWSWLSALQERFECSCPTRPQEPKYVNTDALQAIACGDGGRVDDTVEDLEEYFSRLLAISEYADVVAPRPMCLGWQVQAAETFKGPFVGNTSYPILLIGNSYDPVTPISNAYTVSKGFHRSVVLKQNSAGHCSVAASSACSATRIRAYFRDGELPEPGTVCEAESHMFGPPPSMLAEEYIGEERVVVRAWRQLADHFRVPLLGMPFVQPAARIW